MSRAAARRPRRSAVASALAVVTAVAAAALVSCQPKQTDEMVGAAPAPTPPPAARQQDSAAAPVATIVRADSVRPVAASPGAAAVAAAAEPKPIPHVHPGALPAPNVAVRELVASGAYVGKRVHVTGRCLGYSSAGSLGPPPLTRSDWQLQSSGASIFVSGPLPTGCSATDAGTGTGATPVTILARVAEDTLPSLGKQRGAPRRYLVLIRE